MGRMEMYRLDNQKECKTKENKPDSYKCMDSTLTFILASMLALGSKSNNALTTST